MKAIDLPIPCLVYIKNNRLDSNGGTLTTDNNIIYIYNVQKHAGSNIIISFNYNKTYLGVTAFNIDKDKEFEIVIDEAAINHHKECVLENLHTQLSHGGMYIGSDPEIFVTDKNDVVIPAYSFLPSKNSKKLMTEQSCAVYWDGFQAEFETLAQGCLAYHTDSVQLGIKTVLKAAIKHNPEAQLSLASMLNVPEHELQQAAPEHVAFGCMPSSNVYGMEGIKLDGREVPYRTAGGHIHFGLSDMTPKHVASCVKALDAILGVCCTSLFAGYDDSHRRLMYGLAGEYRTPKHGLEYRTLSNTWLCHPLIMNIVFDLARKAFMFGYKDLMGFWNHNEEETIRIINECDVLGARALMEKNKYVLLKIMSAAYYDLPNAMYVYDIFMKGLDSVIVDPKAIAKNWNANAGDIYIAHTNGVGKCWTMAKNIVPLGKKVS